MCFICYLISIISSISLFTTFHYTFHESGIRNSIHPSHGLRPRVIRISLRISLSLYLYYNIDLILSHKNFGAAVGEGWSEFFVFVFRNCVLKTFLVYIFYKNQKNWKIKNTFPKVFSKIPKRKLQPRLSRGREGVVNQISFPI